MTNFKKEMADLRLEHKSEVSELKNESKQALAELKAECKEEVSQIKEAMENKNNILVEENKKFKCSVKRSSNKN